MFAGFPSELKIKDILGSSITTNSFLATIGLAPYYLLARYENYSEKKDDDNKVPN